MLVPEAIAALADERTEQLKGWLKPADELDGWFISEMGMASARMTQAHHLMLADLERLAEAAETTWDSDRMDYPRKLSFRLAKDCERIAHALGQTKQGAIILLEAWEVLGGILRNNGGWTEPQRQYAFDLLGVAPALRDGHPRLPQGANAAALARLVQTEIDRLRERIDGSLTRKD